MSDLANPDLANPNLADPNLANPDLAGGPLLALEDGTFSRSSSAWALGSDGLLQEYAANELRTEYRADLGLYLLESERANLVAYYRDPTQWTVTGATTDSTSEDDPFGGSNAGQFSGTTGDTIEAPLATQPADSTTVSTAVWVRGSGTVRVRHKAKDGTFVNGSDVTLTSSYQRVDVQGSTLTGATDVLPGVEIRAAGTTVDVSGPQLEEGYFPSSDIVTDGGAAVRAADSLTFTAAEFPDQIRSGSFAFDWYPYYASDEYPPSGRANIFNEDGGFNNGFRFRANGEFEYRGSSGPIVTPVISFSRHQKLTFTVDQQAGSLTIEGATTGNGTYTGTPDPWDPVDMDMAGTNGVNSDNFGRISNIRKA